MKHTIDWEQLLNTLRLADASPNRFKEPGDWQKTLMAKISNTEMSSGNETVTEDVSESLVWKVCGASLAASLVFQVYISFFSAFSESQIVSAFNLEPFSFL